MGDASCRPWPERFKRDVPAFLAGLQVGGEVGRYLPCRRGATALGRRLALGYSCLALKLEYMLQRWETRPAAEQAAWIRFICAYQAAPEAAGEPWRRGAFIDPALDEYWLHFPLLRRISHRLRGRVAPAAGRRKVVVAETKQALATLAEVGAAAAHPYLGCPSTPEGLRAVLAGLDWSQPWGAGGQSAAYAVFAVLEAPRWLPADTAAALRAVCCEVFAEVADPSTGAYFSGPRPDHGNLVNGAMKALTALDWLGQPIHHPETLLATVLSGPPAATGCHVADWVYVVYRCTRETGTVPAAARDGCALALDSLAGHWKPEGGFSYRPGRSQTSYYGAPIARGLDEPDLHGTILLTWAGIMALTVMHGADPGLRVIRP